MYYSQYRQDKFLDKIVFNGKRNGFFVDIGAHDGLAISNSLFFEKSRNWLGVCVEPNPTVFERLEQNRRSKNLNICIGSGNKIVSFTKIEGYAEMLSGVTDRYAPNHLKRIEKETSIHGGNLQTISVEMKRFDAIEDFNNIPIDFISIDTEGNELDIIKSIDFKNSNIKCFVIENNYNDPRISEILKQNEYKHIAKLACDDVYIYKYQLTFFFKIRLIFWRIIISKFNKNLFTKISNLK